MQPAKILMDEHRVIEQVLNCLERLAEQAQQTRELDTDSAKKAIDFFRNFADGCHHGKEENHFFPMMESKGFSPEAGPTNVMRHEHEEGRKLIRAMADAVELAKQKDAKAVDSFAGHALGYVELLRNHIQKEDHCLFPMANQALTADDQNALMESFARVEHEDMGEGTHEKYLQIAEELAERFGVTKALAGCGKGHACGCGH